MRRFLDASAQRRTTVDAQQKGAVPDAAVAERPHRRTITDKVDRVTTCWGRLGGARPHVGHALNGSGGKPCCPAGRTLLAIMRLRQKGVRRLLARRTGDNLSYLDLSSSCESRRV